MTEPIGVGMGTVVKAIVRGFNMHAGGVRLFVLFKMKLYAMSELRLFHHPHYFFVECSKYKINEWWFTRTITFLFNIGYQLAKGSI